MKKIIGLLVLLCSYVCVSGVTAEQLYGPGLAYHTHTEYGLRVMGAEKK